jgi:hypothetical protein
MMGVKNDVLWEEKKIIFRGGGGGDKYRFRTEIYNQVEAALFSMGCVAWEEARRHE